MTVVTCYYRESGRIINVFETRKFVCPSDAELIDTGVGFVVGKPDNEELQYVSGGLFFNRPDMNAALGTRFNNTPPKADGVDSCLIVGLPDPCFITYSGPGFEVVQEVAGGSVELTTDVVGLHRVKVEAWPYLDWEGSFESY